MDVSGLSLPVLRSTRLTHVIEKGASLQRASEVIRQNGTSILPVMADGVFVGVISPAVLAEALVNGVDLADPVDDYLVPTVPIAPYASGAEALRRLSDDPLGVLCVVDDRGALLGLVTAVDLFPRHRPNPRPPAVGGMATPFGVYLTTGAISSGPPKWALMSTGAVMFLFMLLGQGLGLAAGNYAERMHLGVDAANYIAGGLTLLTFFLCFRVFPLAAIHAAEHQVVHAIERGEDLDLAVVRRMPRVHPRCGTNVAAGASIFLTTFGTEWVDSYEIRLMVAALLTVIFWRRLGSLLQKFVTTRPANDRYLAMGIRSGKQLLERFGTGTSTAPSWPQRIWNSGMLQVIAGSSLTGLVAWGVQKATGINLGL